MPTGCYRQYCKRTRQQLLYACLLLTNTCVAFLCIIRCACIRMSVVGYGIYIVILITTLVVTTKLMQLTM
ncbi:hypothetical protein BDF19DRAFT_455576 [Syncephalis fuscata]|nr:hypothetical protein BDF19DRAFT_455551 [Syncephalis fuscata]KAI9591307.1 hypothetical protein BDF19DRAFT_455576 [Syncephalis fuscata]